MPAVHPPSTRGGSSSIRRATLSALSVGLLAGLIGVPAVAYAAPDCTFKRMSPSKRCAPATAEPAPSASPVSSASPSPNVAPSSTSSPATSASPSPVASSPAPTTASPSPAPVATAPVTATYGPASSHDPVSYDSILAVGELTQARLDAQPAGHRFALRPGVHRVTAALRPKTGQQLLGFAGASISGAKVLSGWVQDGSRWYVTGQTQRLGKTLYPPPSYVSTCRADSPQCDATEDVWLDDRPLHQVGTLSELRSGAFFFDYANSRIYIMDNPAGRLVETNVATGLIDAGAATDVVVRNLVLEKSGNPGQSDAVRTGDRWLVERNEVRYAHATGVGLHGSGARLIGNRVVHNGQFGVGGGGVDILVEGNELGHNNAQGFNNRWFAGGTKFDRSTRLTLRGNWVHHNRGVGLATDIDNIDTLIDGNTIEDNLGTGIVIEISYRTRILNNTFRRNGLEDTWWVDKAGVLVYNSSDVEVAFNTVYDGGITMRQDNRLGPGKYGPWEVARTKVHNNVVYGGVTGFNVQDGLDLYAFNNTKGNSFQSNTYYRSATSQSWYRDNQFRTWDQWRGSGYDTTGSLR